MKVSVIICAAGKGERAGFNKNKLLAPLFGAPALYHTVYAASKLSPLLKERGDGLSQLIITASPRDMLEITAICAPFGGIVVEGGATRTDSVYNALKHVTGDIVLIQDGARPFTAPEQYLECLECVKEHKSAVVAMPATDTVYVAKDGWAAHIPQRSDVFAVQTPQGFYTDDIKAAYEKAVKSGESFTDDGSVYSRYIMPAHICPAGSAANRKLTYKEDFDKLNPFCSDLLGQAQKQLKDLGAATRCGFGVDVHAFGKEQDFVMLCGVKVPCDVGLVAHSDGDVALHAVMDAILSAAGLKDIGHYFPDSDPAYGGADSAELLKRVIKLIAENGYAVDGLSVAVQAEKPRLAKHIDEMVERLSLLTGAEKSAISITAGTCEGLGFVGEKRGICVYCTAVLNKIRNAQCAISN
ncbi:MAG: 2-C-methyl-D-erythritol 2,4-cyclodiphosphate synthase [Roseburia sp.]|nr:2-C-methyl-D-erythritol 2,4-cyclodiphosphate synthase [Roseburia sp.]